MTLKYNLFKLNLQPSETITMPPYKGSTIRGAFGVAFKRVVCALRRQSCDDCLLNSRCVYSYVFETKPKEKLSIFGKMAHIPRPYVIEPPLEDKTEYKPDEILSFRLVLIGKATQYLPYFIYAFQELGRSGIGKGRGKFALEEVFNINEDGQRSIYHINSGTLLPVEPQRIDLKKAVKNLLSGWNSLNTIPELTLKFLTPTRIKYQRHLVGKPEFHVLIRQLLRRIFLLWYFHSDESVDDDLNSLKDYHQRLINMATAVEAISENLRWIDWERYSHRQHARMRLGGFTGEITYKNVSEHFLPFLRAGEILHIGKGTAFGLGKFNIL